MYDEAEEYFRDSYPYLIKQLVARRIDPYDAEDIVQEAFSRALKYVGSYNPEHGKFGEWFSRILNRCHKDHNRDLQMRGMVVEVKEDHWSCEQDFGHDNKLIEEIKQDISNLNGTTRDVCYMYYIMSNTPREISKVVEVSPRVAGQMAYMFKQFLIDKYGE